MKDKGEGRAILLGAIIGAASGSVLALLYRRWSRQRQAEGAKPIQSRQVIRLGTALVPVIRQFLELIQ